MADWKQLKIYQGSVWWNPRNEDGVITKKGRWQHFEWYHIAYCLGARELLEGPNVVKVALPIAYMQRHSLELAIKAITSMAYEIDRLNDDLRSLGTDTKETVTEKDPKLVHGFRELLKEANQSLAAIREKNLPTEFSQLTDDFDELDCGHPDRMRYDRYLPDGRKKPSKESFEGYVRLALVNRQEALENLLETHLYWDPTHIDKANTFYWKLAQRMWGTSQAVGEKLYRLGLD